VKGNTRPSANKKPENTEFKNNSQNISKQYILKVKIFTYKKPKRSSITNIAAHI
jgi:hypothetical protein